jgi:hypothetical protein
MCCTPPLTWPRGRAHPRQQQVTEELAAVRAALPGRLWARLHGRDVWQGARRVDEMRALQEGSPARSAWTTGNASGQCWSWRRCDETRCRGRPVDTSTAPTHSAAAELEEPVPCWPGPSTMRRPRQITFTTPPPRLVLRVSVRPGRRTVDALSGRTAESVPWWMFRMPSPRGGAGPAAPAGVGTGCAGGCRQVTATPSRLEPRCSSRSPADRRGRDYFASTPSIPKSSACWNRTPGPGVVAARGDPAGRPAGANCAELADWQLRPSRSRSAGRDD